MNEFKIVDRNVTTFTEVEIAPDARIEWNGGHFSAIFPSNSETKTYVVGSFQYNGGETTVDLPNDSIVLAIESTVVKALVPKKQYVDGGN